MQTLGMARNLRSNRSVAGFFEESDEEELDESFDGSDLEFIEGSDGAPAEPRTSNLSTGKILSVYFVLKAGIMIRYINNRSSNQV